MFGGGKSVEVECFENLEGFLWFVLFIEGECVGCGEIGVFGIGIIVFLGVGVGVVE